MDRATKFLETLSFKSALNIKIKYKDESFLMKLLSYVLFFNKGFSTTYTTTIGKSIYFPSKDMYLADSGTSISIIAHEYVHINDSEKDKLFNFRYLLPQILAPLMLLLAFISWYIALPLFVLFLLPLPAYWRKHYELRGYRMSIYIADELFREKNQNPIDRVNYLNNLVQHYNKQFTTSAYYFMWPFGVEKELNETVDKIVSGDILDEGTLYRQVQSALSESVS